MTGLVAGLFLYLLACAARGLVAIRMLQTLDLVGYAAARLGSWTHPSKRKLLASNGLDERHKVHSNINKFSGMRDWVLSSSRCWCQ